MLVVSVVVIVKNVQGRVPYWSGCAMLSVMPQSVNSELISFFRMLVCSKI